MKSFDYVLLFPGTLYCVASVIGWFIGIPDSPSVAHFGVICYAIGYAIACIAKLAMD